MSVVNYRGRFWAPESPDKDVPGVVSVAETGEVRLELIGSFPTSEWLPVPDQPDLMGSHPIETPSHLLGVVGTTEISLLGCTMIHTSRGTRADEQTHIVDRLIVGTHVATVDEPMFTGVRFGVEHLSFWAARSGIQRSSYTQGNTVLPRSTGEQEQVAPVSLTHGDLTITLRVWNTPFEIRREAEGTFVESREWAFLEATAEAPRSLGDWDTTVKSLQDLVTLSMGAPCAVTSRRLQKDGAGPLWNVEVFGEELYTSVERDEDKLRRQTLLTCHAVPFEKMVPAWLDLRAGSELSLSILASTLYDDSGYLESRVMTTCIALEGLHRDLYDHAAMDEEVFREMKDAALGGLQGSDRAWVSSRLHNVLSYLDRARELAEKPDPDAVTTLVGDRDAWAKEVRNARNGGAHSKGSSQQSSEMLFHLMYVTRRLLNLVVLQELGASSDQQQTAVGVTSSIWFQAGELKRLVGVGRGTT